MSSSVEGGLEDKVDSKVHNGKAKLDVLGGTDFWKMSNLVDDIIDIPLHEKETVKSKYYYSS